MKVTLEQIARMAGVSRGIVDRVYHNRGYVKAEKAEIVRRLLEQHNYKPNKLARALSVSQNKKRIKVILNSVGNDYFRDVISGINQAAKELIGYGLDVELVQLRGFAAAAQLDAMEEALTDGVDGLVLTPVNEPAIASQINRMTTQGIPVITVNTDIDHSSRDSYIGCNYRQSGAMAGGFLTLLADGRPMKTAVIQGSEHVKGHLDRLEGFLNEIKKQPALSICATAVCNDDETLAFESARAIIRDHQPDCIYVVAGGLAGVMQAIQATGSTVKVLANDLTPAAIEGLQSGIIQATVCQQPFRQGYLAIRSLFEHIYQDNRLSEQDNAIELTYITRYNLP